MKKRIKIDGTLLSSVIVLTGVLYQFPQLYSSSRALDNIMDFFGIVFILKGIYIRMAARGYKKAKSFNSKGLVTNGLYRHMRNPMYLGSFMIGCGFTLITWPWWLVPVFGIIFYLRFRRQVVKEEKKLNKLFGKEYEDYCAKTPRIFPRFGDLLKMNVRECFPMETTWATKEKRNLLGLPIAALVVELLQEKIVFNIFDIRTILVTIFIAAVVFGLGLLYRYKNA